MFYAYLTRVAPYFYSKIWFRALLGFLTLAFTQAYFWKKIFSKQYFTAWDKFDLIFPNLLFFTDSLRSGVLPFWNPLTSVGEAIYQNINFVIFYTPLTLIFMGFQTFLNPILAHEALLQTVVLYGSLGAFFFLRLNKIAFFAALLSAALYGPLLNNLILGQPGVLCSVAAMPWLFYWTYRFKDAKNLPTLPLAILNVFLISSIMVNGYPFLNLCIIISCAIIFLFNKGNGLKVNAWQLTLKEFLLPALFIGSLLLIYLAFVYPALLSYKQSYAQFNGNFDPPDRLIRTPFIKTQGSVFVASINDSVQEIIFESGWNLGVGILIIFGISLGRRYYRKPQKLMILISLTIIITLVILYAAGYITRNTQINRWVNVSYFLAQACFIFLFGFSIHSFIKMGRNKDLMFASVITLLIFVFFHQESKSQNLSTPFFFVIFFVLLFKTKLTGFYRKTLIFLLFLCIIIDKNHLFEQKKFFLYDYKVNSEVQLSEKRIVNPVITTNQRWVIPRKEFAFDVRNWVYDKQGFSDWYNPLGEPFAWYFKNVPFFTNYVSFKSSPLVLDIPPRANFNHDNAYVSACINPILTISNHQIQVSSAETFKEVPQENIALSQLTNFVLKVNELQFDCTIPKGGVYALITQHFQPGWNLRIDGEKAKVVKANLILMGAYLPEGTHHVSLTFRPPLSFILLLCFFWFGFILSGLWSFKNFIQLLVQDHLPQPPTVSQHADLKNFSKHD